ncbi:ribonuclease J [Mesoterricola silvestris]|uniref:Ribonuclease J n=1 Tax=Mesoterricola silvestris TaxID=2927979 RepID=A0AA48GZR0_9BACT|nr:ribonuclease J [Mesoterricola silvestris]BDU73363.1 ribonuclease J [Mesoterricola silvestris]
MDFASPPFIDWQNPPAKDELRLIPIGGLGEFGMNALVVHTAKSLFLVDCGQLFPSEDQPGIDSIIPDFAYLEPFAERIDAVLLTHGHEDHLGALPYFLERWPVPVYGTAFTMGLLEGKLREHELWSPRHMHVVEDFAKVKVGRGEIQAEWIPVTHSIPDACAIALHTPWGVVVHTGDYKLDPSPVDGRLTGTARLTELGDQGVAVLLSDSTNILNTKPTPSEEECRGGLRDAFRATKGKLFTATFSSNIHRIQIFLDLAYEEGRKVCLLGRSMERNVTVARSLKRLALPDDLFIEPKEVPLFPPKKVAVLCTGSQGEEMAALQRILKGEVKGLKMVDGDRLLLSSRAIPGNEVSISRTLDTAARLGAETTLEGIGVVHATGHGHRPDSAAMISMVRPRHMVPVHGTYRNLKVHAQLAASMGYDKEHILFLDGGECLRLFKDGRVQEAGSVPVGKCFVDQGVDHMVDARVIHDRLILQEDGIVIATLVVDPDTGDLAAEPSILTRGFVVLNDDQAYSELLRLTVRNAFDEAPREIRKDRDLLVEFLRQSLRRTIRKTTQTRPVVVPMILETGGGEAPPPPAPAPRKRKR